MTADTPPIAAPDAAPKKVYERKTRVPDWFVEEILRAEASGRPRTS